MTTTGWTLAPGGKSMTHADGGTVSATGAVLGVWQCNGCNKRSEPADLDDVWTFANWRDQHRSCAPRRTAR